MLDAVLQARAIGPHTHVFATWLFLRLLGLIYLAAFVSLGVQIRGLAGRRGIAPVAELLPAPDRSRLRLFFRLPTLCWWNTSDRFLDLLCWGGAVLSLALIAGLAPVPVLVLLWLFYLSLVNACGVFLAFQWDALLVEMGFLAIFLAPMELLSVFPPQTAPPLVPRWLMSWLLFRLMFSSGMVKLRSGDSSWRSLTALDYHYETQPLPNRVAWYMHRLPPWFQKVSVAVMFVIELAVPFFVFAPAPACDIAAGLIGLLMLLIFLTGNYCFFNLQGIALCVLVFDDAWFLSIAGEAVPLPEAAALPPLWWNTVGAVVGLGLLLLSLDPVVRLFRQSLRWPRPLAKFLRTLTPLRLVNPYGLFAVMTTRRPEIVVEGSRDGLTWHACEFKWKPGDLRRPPRQVAPHQPRLDWQMWFAALGACHANPWFLNFLDRLLEGSPEVLRLLKDSPFADEPPQFVRASLYDYHFTDFAERRRTGAWWRREYRGMYCPPVTLRESR